MRPASPARDLALVAVFAALVAAASIAPGIPIGPVPITLQTLMVVLTGLVLGPLRGFLAVLLYVVVGLAGLPVFSGGAGGLGILVKPSAGYLLAFAPAAAAAGGLAILLARGDRRWLPARLSLAGIIASLLVIHPAGIVGLMVNARLSFSKALAVDLAFVPGDIAKAVLAGLVAAAVRRAFPALVAPRPAAAPVGPEPLR